MANVFTFLTKIAGNSKLNETTSYIKIEKVDDGHMRLLATSNERCGIITTHMIPDVPEGLYVMTKNKDGIYINPVVVTDSNFPDINRIILKSWGIEYKVAASISKETAVYPILFNKSGDENKSFRFVQLDYIKDFTNLIDPGSVVVMKTKIDDSSPFMLECSCVDFNVLYIVMPMTASTRNILKKVVTE
jgi:hypothetical protein